VLVEPGRLEVREVPEPRLGPGEVLVRNRVAGVCGSDIHIYANKLPQFTAQVLGKVLGHELCGEVAAVASDVTRVKPGDRVGVEPLMGCQHCVDCTVGNYHLCPELKHVGIAWSGGFGEYAKAPAENVYVLPPSVSYEDASLLDCLAVGLHAVHRAGIHPGSRVLVLGGGAIGLATAHCAKWAGAALVALATRSSRARQVARETGIDVGIDTAAEDLAGRVGQLTGGRGMDVVFEAVGGNQPTVQKALPLTRPGGKIGIIGAFTAPQALDLMELLRKEIDLVSCWSYAKWDGTPEFQLSLEGLAAGKLFGEPYITHRFALDEIGPAFHAAENKAASDAVKVSIYP
jgi:L-iditol 2-dehydrogenase